jgi:hypothetical protein
LTRDIIPSRPTTHGIAAVSHRQALSLSGNGARFGRAVPHAPHNVLAVQVASYKLIPVIHVKRWFSLASPGASVAARPLLHSSDNGECATDVLWCGELLSSQSRFAPFRISRRDPSWTRCLARLGSRPDIPSPTSHPESRSRRAAPSTKMTSLVPVDASGQPSAAARVSGLECERRQLGVLCAAARRRGAYEGFRRVRSVEGHLDGSACFRVAASTARSPTHDSDTEK